MLFFEVIERDKSTHFIFIFWTIFDSKFYKNFSFSCHGDKHQLSPSAS